MGAASREKEAQIFADRGNFEEFTFQLQQGGQDWSGRHNL